MKNAMTGIPSVLYVISPSRVAVPICAHASLTSNRHISFFLWRADTPLPITYISGNIYIYVVNYENTCAS